MSLVIGLLKEMGSEGRVAMNADSVESLITHTRHSIIVTSGAGEKSNVSNEKYIKAGATIVADNESVIKQSDIIVKIGRPTNEEINFFREGQILFCFLNLIVDPNYAKKLAQKKITAIGYESIYEPEQKRYPILATMSELVGKMCYNIGANLLSTPGNKGVFLGGLGSTSRSKVVIFGGGNAGQAFMKMADNAGSRVVVFEKSLELTQKINAERPHIETMFPFEGLIKKEIKNADLVLGATFDGNKKVVKYISNQMLKDMESKSVIIDLTHEFGGITDVTSYQNESNTITTTKNDIIHYWKPNIASLAPKTATSALAAPILKYLIYYLIAKQTDAPNEIIDNATAVHKGVISDWISFGEVEKNEYHKEIEHLIQDPEEEFDLFQMMNHNSDDDYNLFDDIEEYEKDENNHKNNHKEIIKPEIKLFEEDEEAGIKRFLEKGKKSTSPEPENEDGDDFDNFNFDDLKF